MHVCKLYKKIKAIVIHMTYAEYLNNAIIKCSTYTDNVLV